jgi:hypothetical protein
MDEDEDVIKLDISVKHLRILYLKTYTQLVELDCGYNYIQKLPELPETLRHLNCGMNHLSRLPKLPNLITLICSTNHIQRLPKLPDTLKKLNCSANLLNTLPRLPKLEELSCSKNGLDRVKLPDTIKIFYCYSNFIKNLKLPNYLEVLNCRNNGIETLELNKHLRELECSKNKLTHITFNESLTEANISYNRIKKISNLPNSILTLNIKCTDIDECFHIPKQLACIYSYGSPIYNKVQCFFKTEQPVYYTFIISYAFEHIKRIESNFKYTYYCLNLKEGLMRWLWRTREKIAMEKYHPDKLVEILKNGYDALDDW